MEPTFKAGVPKTLFQGDYFSQYNHQWDISPDGKRFLMLKPPTGADGLSTAAGPRNFVVIVNWFEELKQRVPVD